VITLRPSTSLLVGSAFPEHFDPRDPRVMSGVQSVDGLTMALFSKEQRKFNVFSVVANGKLTVSFLTGDEFSC
jgi:hypothetical protein